MMEEYRALGRAVLEQRVTLWKRYWINEVSALVTMLVMFSLVFFGANAMAPSAIGDTLPALIVGFFVWTMSFSAFQEPSQALMKEAQWGTLEQLHLTPHGILRILGIRTMAYLAYQVGFGLALLFLMMALSGETLHVDPVTVIPLSLLTICTATGIGFALGGLAIIYKRISNTFLLVQFLFVGALMAPSEPYVLNLLPLTLGFDLLSVAMEEGTRLWELPVMDLGVLVVVAIGYLALGAIVFNYSIRVARSRGVMGHY